jgi:hypothetical protein
MVAETPAALVSVIASTARPSASDPAGARWASAAIAPTGRQLSTIANKAGITLNKAASTNDGVDGPTANIYSDK